MKRDYSKLSEQIKVFIWMGIIILLPAIPARALNIYVGSETGTILCFVWFVFIYNCPPAWFGKLRRRTF